MVQYKRRKASVLARVQSIAGLHNGAHLTRSGLHRLNPLGEGSREIMPVAARQSNRKFGPTVNTPGVTSLPLGHSL